MAAAVHPPVSRLLDLLPRRLHDALDAWSHRVARRRAEARRRRGERKVAPVPPVVKRSG